MTQSSSNLLSPNLKISGAPVVSRMEVVPVAGRDGMLLNLSGAHAPFFTRNIVLPTDNSGHVGVGEVPGGEKIWRTLEDARDLIVGKSIGASNDLLNAMRAQFADRDKSASMASGKVRKKSQSKRRPTSTASARTGRSRP